MFIPNSDPIFFQIWNPNVKKKKKTIKFLK